MVVDNKHLPLSACIYHYLLLLCTKYNRLAFVRLALFSMPITRYPR